MQPSPLQKLMTVQLAKKLHAFYGFVSFNSVRTSIRCLDLSWPCPPDPSPRSQTLCGQFYHHPPAYAVASFVITLLPTQWPVLSSPSCLRSGQFYHHPPFYAVGYLGTIRGSIAYLLIAYQITSAELTTETEIFCVARHLWHHINVPGVSKTYTHVRVWAFLDVPSDDSQLSCFLWHAILITDVNPQTVSWQQQLIWRQHIGCLIIITPATCRPSKAMGLVTSRTTIKCLRNLQATWFCGPL